MPQRQSQYIYNYTKENYDRISIYFPKGTKQEIIDKTGESVNAFVNRVVREALDRMDEKVTEDKANA